MNNINRFKLSKTKTIEDIKKNIFNKYSMHKIGRSKGMLIYYDSFDWRLFRQNFILYKEDNTLFLKKNIFTPLQLDNIQKVPTYISDFPQSEIKNILEIIVEMRALLSQLEIQYTRDSYNILNNDKKTILKIVYESYPNLSNYISIYSIRGYENQIAKFLNQVNIEARQTQIDDLFTEAFSYNKIIPGHYNHKLNISLRPEMRSDEAAKIILKNLLVILKQNEQGIVNDIDTEFLHDYRVSVRKTRAVLSQIKYTFDENNTEKYTVGFAQLGKLTNKMRDIDVYLLTRDEYKRRLPQNMKESIDPFFEYLESARIGELKKIDRYFKTKGYINLLTDWDQFLSSAPIDSAYARNGKIPIIDLSKKFIKKRHIRVMEMGNSINDNTPDEVLHRLRIQCKKLRYLVEFFRSLFPEDKMTILILNLKTLQDNLGIFNDLSVQQESLKQFITTESFQTETILTIGYLVGKLNDEQQIVREDFKKSFTIFSNSETQKIFKQLF